MKYLFVGGSKHGQLEESQHPRSHLTVPMADLAPSPLPLESVPVPPRPHWWQRILAKLAGVPRAITTLMTPPQLYQEEYDLRIYRDYWDPDRYLEDQPDRMFGVYVLRGLQSKVALNDEVWSMAHYLGLPPPHCVYDPS
jgi:hypothetical protein